MNDDKKKVNPIILIAGIFIVIEFAAIVGVIIGIINRGKENSYIETEKEMFYGLEITNFRQEIKDIERNGMKDITFAVYDAVWLNIGENKNKIESSILEGSVEKVYYTDNDLHKLSFLIDVPSIDQVFQVVHFYSDSYDSVPKGYRTMVFCPKNSDSCRDRYAGKAEQILKKLGYN